MCGDMGEVQVRGTFTLSYKNKLPISRSSCFDTRATRRGSACVIRCKSHSKEHRQHSAMKATVKHGTQSGHGRQLVADPADHHADSMPLLPLPLLLPMARLCADMTACK